MRKTINQRGFTMIELMIATSVFSVVMLILTISVMHFTNSYYRGLTDASTQSVARNVAAQITQAIQFSGDEVIALTPLHPSQPGGIGAYCVGGKLFSYKIGVEQQGGSSNVLVVSPDPGCSASNIAPSFSTGSGAQGLLGANMWLADFSITPVSSAIIPNGSATDVKALLYSVKVRVLYGSSDLLTSTVGDGAYCKGITGSQFCATSGLASIVEARVQ